MRARTRSGQDVHPGSGAIPILKDIEPGRLKIVGTGFFITRYGLFATARHVLQELADIEQGKLDNGFVLEHESSPFLVETLHGS